MLNLIDIGLFFVAVGIVRFVWIHINVNRIAKQAAKRHCEKGDLQFLDQSIVFKRYKIKRSPHSVFALQRSYVFEFSSVGDKRYQGQVDMIGYRVLNIALDAYKLA